jgi:carbonic anhydrase
VATDAPDVSVLSSNQQIGANVFELDQYVIAAQPDFDERKTRAEFRRFVGHLRTVVIHCFDPRVTSGIPYAVADALPDQEYPGDLFETVDDAGKTQFGTTTTIFPVVNAGGKADAGAQRSITVACHLFDIDNVAIVHHTDCGATHFTGEGLIERFKEEFDQDVSSLYKPGDIGTIKSFEKSLATDVALVRNSVGTPRHLNVYGYCYEIETGKLHLLEESPGDPTAPRGAAWR